jgi:hypothetical protein
MTKQASLDEKGFWTLQKKILAVALTIGAIAGAWAALASGSDHIEKKFVASVEKISAAVADTLDKKRWLERKPIDSAILSQLKSIQMDLRKSAYVAEKTMTPASWNRTQASWRSDSIRFFGSQQ